MRGGGLRSCAALLLLLLCLPAARSLRVTSADVSPLTAGAVAHERVVHEWQVTVGDAPDDSALTGIVASLSCQVYVSYAADPPAGSDALATVRITGSSDAIVRDYVSVSSSAGRLRLAGPARTTYTRYSGYVRVEVIVHNSVQLALIQASGYGTLVVGENVLRSSSSATGVTIKASGSGDIYVALQSALTVDSLELSSIGYGSVYASLGDLTVQSVSAATSGSGSVKLNARVLQATALIDVSTTGYGSVDVSASVIYTPSVQVKNAGSGDAVVSSSARSPPAETCSFANSGYGNVDARSLVCQSATVASLGSGDVTVQVKDALTYTDSGYGNVYYAGAAPQVITRPQGKKSTARAASSSAPLWIEQPSWLRGFSLPTRKALHVDFINADGNYIDYTDDADDADDDDTDDDDVGPHPPDGEGTVQTNPTAASTKAKPMTNFPRLWVGLTAAFVLVLLLSNRVNTWRNRQKTLSEMSPLVSKDAPVYI